MAHGPKPIEEHDKTPLGAKAWPAWRTCIVLAIVGAVLLVTALIPADLVVVGGGLTRLAFAYLVGYSFFLALTVGSLALVLLTTLFRAGWVVAVRRVPETFAANFLWLLLLGLPIVIIGFADQHGTVYPWAISQANLEDKIEEAHHVLHPHGDHHGEEDGEHSDAPTTDEAFAHVIPAADADGVGTTDHASDGVHGLTGRNIGQAYPDDTGEALAIQDANYVGLLAYMLDKKRFDGAIEGGELVPEGKGMLVPWYNPLFFAFRVVLYLALFSVMGRFLWKHSVRQDETADPGLTTKREWWAPPMTIAFAVVTTFCSFDILMSLDPAWFSTMFGVIFFANSFLAGIATTILVCLALQKKGFLKAVNVEHYHDLGKLLFAFTFFWGYVSFSQFMLIWYASLPETTYWFELRGATTVLSAPQHGSGWQWIILILLFGHLIVPFGFLLSRHVKRNLTLLSLAAVWMLLMVYLDLFWYIMPAYKSPAVTFGLPEIGAVLMVGGVVFAQFFARFKQHAPVPYNDPRMHESTALDTSAWAPIHH